MLFIPRPALKTEIWSILCVHMSRIGFCWSWANKIYPTLHSYSWNAQTSWQPLTTQWFGKREGEKCIKKKILIPNIEVCRIFFSPAWNFKFSHMNRCQKQWVHLAPLMIAVINIEDFLSTEHMLKWHQCSSGIWADNSDICIISSLNPGSSYTLYLILVYYVK